MRSEIHILDLGRGETQLAGRALGADRYTNVIEPVVRSLSPRSILLLSFRDVEFATGSFFKATWHALHPDEGAAVPSAVAHLSGEVREEFSIFLKGHRLLGLEAVDWTAKAISLAKVHGQVEGSELRAVEALCSKPGATAPELQSLSHDGVSPTAWTNRLNELHRQGLAFREKAGRAWRFFPIAQEVQRG
jgi:hypothetical protein